MSQSAGVGQVANPENQELIDQFVEITGVDQDRARFYLETAAFDLPLALSGFYEGGFEEDTEQPEILFDREADEDVQIVEEPLVDNDIVIDRPNAFAAMTGRGGKGGEDKKFATLGSVGGKREDSSSSEEDEDKGQAFYVGGSEKSGQQVLGPPKKKGDNIAENFFQRARERGAEQINPSQRAAASAGAGSSSAFAGVGYRLGDAVKPPEAVGAGAGAGVGSDDRASPEHVTVIMRMWRNGFTIDDEPLRTFEAPADRSFMEHIMQGRLPPELLQAHRGKQINLEMEDHRNEEYKPPKRALKAFSGHGHTLGSPVPEVIGAGKIGEKANAVTSSGGASAAAINEPVSLPIDESKPVTNIQVRLNNGERLVLKLNHSHTVKDLREFICKLRPDLSGRAFVLMTNFPNKELTEESLTLEQAKLLNAVIIQRFK